jgi:hypothetical protein
MQHEIYSPDQGLRPVSDGAQGGRPPVVCSNAISHHAVSGNQGLRSCCQRGCIHRINGSDIMRPNISQTLRCHVWSLLSIQHTRTARKIEDPVLRPFGSYGCSRVTGYTETIPELKRDAPVRATHNVLYAWATNRAVFKPAPPPVMTRSGINGWDFRIMVLSSPRASARPLCGGACTLRKVHARKDQKEARRRD